MSTRNFALISGIIMLVTGCLALVPALNSGIETLPVLYTDTSYGLFFDLFPMNIYNKIALIVFGLAGMSTSFFYDPLNASIIFSKIVFWVMGTLAVFGLFPQTNTLSGYWPLYGYEVFLHGVFAVLAGYFGYLSYREPYQKKPQHRPHRFHKA